jgi:hypothetical protein
MTKITFSTLKSLANKGKLFHNIRGQFDGMIDGIEFTDKINWTKTTIENLVDFKCSRNWLKKEGELIKLSNCCFYITFKIN